ncbi:uncharacterized protein LOC131881629 isoform X2 [Tigriopus californicus]|nr:uncharacterized protein LOC131881629 isoform X2 [Tigriopus californicus]
MKESDSEDEEIAYNSAYKTKCTGLGALLGTLRADPSPDVDALQSPPSALKDKSYLQTVCDTGGANAGPRLVASQRVTEFRCDLCDLELNSESMYFQHIQGQKHSKRLKIHQTVNSNANLRTLIEESTSPVVALHYVEELLPESQRISCCEPRYSCTLCGITGPSQNIYSHLVGSRHRTKYFVMRFGADPSALSKLDVMTMAKELEEQEGRRTHLIRTIRSDIKYPWPAGKAPWSVEQGGSGVAPPGSGDVIYNSQKICLDAEGELKHQGPEEERPSRTQLRHVVQSLTECSVNSSEDAELAFQASRTLIQRLIQYKVPLCEQSKVTSLKACGDNLIQSLETIMMMPTQNPSRLDSGPRTPPSPDRDHFTMRSQRMGKKRAYPLSTQDGPSHY